MDVITCSSNPYSTVNIARRNYHLAKVIWGLANKGKKDKSEAARNMNKARNAMRELLYGAAVKYEPQVLTVVEGVPCGVVVQSYTPGHNGGPDEQPADPEVEWFLVDRKGYEAPWLERKLTAKDVQDIDYRLIYEARHGR